jgi:hypothetical protein
VKGLRGDVSACTTYPMAEMPHGGGDGFRLVAPLAVLGITACPVILPTG